MGLEHFNNFYSIISERQAIYLADQESLEFLCVDDSDVSDFQAKLKNEFGLDSEDIYGFKVRVQIRQLNYKIYWNLEEFNIDFFTKNESALEKKNGINTAIINYNDNSNSSVETFFYDAATQKTYINFAESHNNFLISNSYYYLKFLQFLKRQENNEDGHYHFVDNFNWDNETIIFVSPQKEGKMSLIFQEKVPNFDAQVSLKSRFVRFFDAFDETDRNQKFPKFIKAELFNNLSSEPKEYRIIHWIRSMNELLDVAQQNFDIYLSDLSIENIKKDYIEAKDRYLAQLREVVNKIAVQTIALPISISAVALATYTVPVGINRESILWVLIIVFSVYTIFALFLLKIQTDDIDDTRENYIYEFEKLTKSSFFIKFPQEIEYFDLIKIKVMHKIDTIRAALYTYIFLFILTNGFLIYKLLVEVNFYPFIGVFVVEILFGGFFGVAKSGKWASIYSTEKNKP